MGTHTTIHIYRSRQVKVSYITLTSVKLSNLNDLVWLVSIPTLSTLDILASLAPGKGSETRFFLFRASSEKRTLEADESRFSFCCFLAAFSRMDFLP